MINLLKSIENSPWHRIHILGNLEVSRTEPGPLCRAGTIGWKFRKFLQPVLGNSYSDLSSSSLETPSQRSSEKFLYVLASNRGCLQDQKPPLLFPQTINTMKCPRNPTDHRAQFPLDRDPLQVTACNRIETSGHASNFWPSLLKVPTPTY